MSEFYVFFFLMIRRPPRSTLDRSSAASDVYKRQDVMIDIDFGVNSTIEIHNNSLTGTVSILNNDVSLSLIHISEPTRPY